MSKSSTAVIVLNWNDADLLPKSVGSLLRQTEKCDVIVVDNASSDKSREVIESFGDKITALWNTKNKGFAGGVNTGIRYALNRGYTHIALLNNDAVADKGWSRHLRQGFTDKRVGAVTCSFIHEDRKHYDSTGEIYTTWGLAYPRGRKEPIKNQYDEQIDITAVSGGASMFSSDFLKAVGLFDEDFFAYYEDVDLGLRGQLQGFTFKFTPKAKAYHATSTTSGRISGFNTYQELKNLPWLFIKNTPLSLFPAMLPRFTLAYMSIIFGKLARGEIAPVAKGLSVTILGFPRKILQRFTIQKHRQITAEGFYSMLMHDIPTSSVKLRRLRSSYRRILGRKS